MNETGVSGSVPLPEKTLGCFSIVLIVTGKQELAADDDLARVVGRQGVSVGADNINLQAWNYPAHRKYPARWLAVNGGDGAVVVGKRVRIGGVFPRFLSQGCLRDGEYRFRHCIAAVRSEEHTSELQSPRHL